jgi:hypothetical protein
MQRVTEATREYIRAEVDRLIETYPIHIRIDGKDVDPDDITIAGGQIDIEIRTPLYFPETEEEKYLINKKNLKLFIQLNPEMYEEKYSELFTNIEKINLSQSMRP